MNINDLFEMVLKPYKKQVKSLFEDTEVLLEDDEDDTSDDSDEFSNDNDEDDENGLDVEMDLQSKNEIANIKYTIDKLIRISEYMLIVKNSDFYDILTKLYKIKYLFSIYINNYNSYDDKDHRKIIQAFKKSILLIIKELNNKI